MARRLTKEAIRGLLKKGLTGWEAGKLILQDLIDSYHGRDSVLIEADMEVIRHAPMKGADVWDYNMFMALCRGFHVGYMLGEWTCVDACLHTILLERMLRDVDKRRTVELFESFGPRVVTRKQYEDIVAAQREKKLKFEYSLGYVIEERFYAIAPGGVRSEIEGLGIDIESAESFTAAVPEKYTKLYKQAVSEVRQLYIEDKLKVVYHDEDTKVVEPLLNEWKKQNLSDKEVLKLLDMLFVAGQILYDCNELPEWKDYMDKYNQYLFGDGDERFRYNYAIFEDCPECWLDEQGYYKRPIKPSKWITQGTELNLGLINHDDKAKKPIKSVRVELRDRLDTAEQNIRLFLATKAILDAAADAVELDVPGDEGMLANPNIRLLATIDLYNIRLEELNEERKSWESGETRLEKALKILPTIDTEKLRPTSESLNKLKSEILKDAQGEEWLRTKVFSLEYDDGYSFRELTEKA